MEGWIKLHRSFLEHWLCDEYRPLTKREAWETMLFTVNYEEKKVLIKNQIYTCERGQSLLSLQNWADKFVWSIQNVRSFFKLLESDNMIITEGLQHTTRLTICNYDRYQDNQHADNTQPTGSQQAANRQLTTTKEIKKEKNNKNKYDFVLSKFLESFLTWMEYKAERKETYKSDKSEKAFYNKLIKLSNNDPKIAAEIVEQSMANNWAGIFELKLNNNGTHQQNNGQFPVGKFTTLAEAMEKKEV
jgi:hypothetical protein